jgi:hypothetical protein
MPVVQNAFSATSLRGLLKTCRPTAGEDFFLQARRQVPPIPVGIAWILLTTADGKKTGDGRGGGF